MQQQVVRHGSTAAGVVLAMAAVVSASAQKATPAEVAEKMSGTWKLNRELSPGAGGTGPRRHRRPWPRRRRS